MGLKKANGVSYYQDWDNSEGGIRMIDAKTAKRYRELRGEQPKSENYGVFFAFGEKQFDEGYQELIRKGYIKKGDKVCEAGAGMYGTREELDRYFSFYKERKEKIAKECDPQEVYFIEWNNHECMFSDDDDALKVVIDYFGNEAAHKIVRVYPGTPTNILAPLNERDKHLGEHQDTMMMLSRLKFDCEGFFSSGDCRYHRPDCLWGRSVPRQLEEIRKCYDQLPDDIKDASPLSKEQIDLYQKQFDEWASEEFSKAEYDPVRRTDIADVPEEIKICDTLFYYDDDGKMQEPTHIWFSSDTRRWHKNALHCHGRAMTSYLGKNGTTLTPVYALGLNSKPYHRKDLCDITCRYEKKYEKGYTGRLYGFYYE